MKKHMIEKIEGNRKIYSQDANAVYTINDLHLLTLQPTQFFGERRASKSMKE